MQFDFYGNLFPPQIIEIDLVTFEEVFVNSFPKSKTRKKLFDDYLTYIAGFKQAISPTFYQWINGSFVTSKQNPNDIDIVTFLESAIYKEHLLQLKPYKGLTLFQEKSLDCYFVECFPENHEMYETITLPDTLEWLHLFSKTRPDHKGQKNPKGFIKICFEP